MILPMIVRALEHVTIQLNVIDEGSGINEILLPDGTTSTDADIEYTITKNGFYKFTAYDNAGNVAHEFVIEVSDINRNTNMGEIENIIYKVKTELDELSDGDEKDRLDEQLKKLKGDYDDEIKSRIDSISESINNMVSLDEEEMIKHQIRDLPEKYQLNKYTPSLEEEKKTLNQKLLDKIIELANKNNSEVGKTNKTPNQEEDKAEEPWTINNYNKTLHEAIESVKRAEKTLQQIDLDSAWIVVKLLPDGRDGDELFDRLNIVRELIFAIKQIEKDINNMNSLEDEFWIQREIDRLPSGSEKSRLQEKLDSKVSELIGLQLKNDDKVLEQSQEAIDNKAERTAIDSKYLTSKPSTNQNFSSSSINDMNYIPTENMKDEENINTNFYYKKPIREKQSKFFKLKEPKLPEKDDHDKYDNYIKIEDETPEIMEEVKPQKGKLTIIILALLLIAGIGTGITLFIRTKNRKKEDSYD